MSNSYDTIAAISTAIGEAGIAIVRMSGEQSVAIADSVFEAKNKKTLKEAENRTLIYGFIKDKEKNELYDEVLAVKMKGPYSYTAEDIVEIHCHGGIVSVRRILNLLLRKGARLAERGEFTKRGFLNGRIDLSQAEAVIDLIQSKTEKSFDISLQQLEGSISHEMGKIHDEVVGMQALIVANIDFPEDEIVQATYQDLKERGQKVLEEIQKILNNSKRARLLRDGIHTVILGKPNVGKSSLLNGMLKYERAIVTDIPGTTRDVIEDYVNLEGLLLKITDTAGIRDTDDKVEQIGVEMARQKIDNADLIIALFDTSLPFEGDDYEIIDLIKDKKSLILLNKSDLDSQVSEEDIGDLLGDRDYLRLSVQDPKEIQKVEQVIQEMFFQGELVQKDELYITNMRHIHALESAKTAMEHVMEDIDQEMFLDLLEVNLEEVLEEISKITGAITTEDVLDRVFSEFCIGK